jgi:DNA-binding transcriptional ArsR family regulator
MTADHLSAAFAALADPTRRAILARLAEGEASVGELAAPFAMSLPAISKHLSVLERARLIRRRKDAQWRRCVLRPEGLRAADAWIRQYERFWTESLERLADQLNQEDDTDGNGQTEPG